MRIVHLAGITVLMVGILVLAGCSTPKSGGSVKTGDPKQSSDIPPTALPVLKEKMIKKEPLNMNDQVALHMLTSDERQKLMEEVNKAKH